jgi:uncharacterized alpha-E superfamily protein
MLSRVADSLYWMSRYLERAEHTARLVSVNLNLTLDRAPAGAVRHWGRLLASLRMPPRVAEVRTVAEVAAGSTLDLANRDSIAACIAVSRENARQVREQISSEMWEELNRLFLKVQRADPGGYDWSGGTHDFLASVIEGVHLFQGVTDATMTHGDGWRFIELGRYLERAGATAALLDVHYRDFAGAATQPADVGDYVEWVGLLKSCCAFEAYCHHCTADLHTVKIAEFLILNQDFPRSIRFCAGRIQEALEAVLEDTSRPRGRADRLAGRLLASLDFGQVDEILGDLPAYLAGIVRQTGEIDVAVHQQYIDYPVDAGLPA